jgi:hypothetical protein
MQPQIAQKSIYWCSGKLVFGDISLKTKRGINGPVSNADKADVAELKVVEELGSTTLAPQVQHLHILTHVRWSRWSPKSTIQPGLRK